ncbi:LacI family DNA-binding transcriptional regulator [Demequina sp. NBRC 110054]|uniref:LacI family DNA-binding transcriptional regulator n=1 Tax=Demequina sp. NBRC 110054 TaxID=1570343 RepID=UPI000A04A5EB|nr:LacI family DNA-binding transcriptional regulator [Demequina sp. NBRC 110054]
MSDHRHVTLAAVAKAAGVAKSTASHVFTGKRVVAPETAERVRRAAEAMGYTGPSALGRALASGRTHLIAVVTHALLEDKDTDPLSLAILDGLQREFAAAGYGIVIIPPITDEASRELAHAVLYDAVVSVRRMVGFEETDPYLASRKVPWIALDGHMNEEGAVRMDDAAATEELARRVLAAGHTRIALAGYAFAVEERPDTLTTFDELYAIAPENVQRRLDGFIRAGVEPMAVFQCGSVTRASGEAAGEALLGLDEPPTCVLTTADIHAAGIIDYARRAGVRVPEDLSVTGFDAIPLPGFDHGELCTIVQDGVEKGRIVARRLLRELDVANAVRAGEEPEPLGEPEELPLPIRWGTTVATLG